jgi:predicted phage terminase large subunit-like protein
MNHQAPDNFKNLLRHDLYNFAISSFYELNPHANFMENWHLEVIAAKLEACRRGEIRRLIINLPPRQLKSILASVALPAYLLGHDPTKQIICVSYGQDLAEKMARDTRNIMVSPRYKELFGTRLLSDRCSLNELVTTHNGSRFATSVGGVLTGRGADFIIIDDPLKPEEALSESRRKAVNEWHDNTLLSRLNSKVTGTIVIIMQRLHEDDLIGHVLPQDDWEVVSFPAIADQDEEHRIISPFGERIVTRRAGEVLHPEREPLPQLEKIREAMGEYNFAAQYQQQPIPPGGAMIKSNWLQYYEPEQIFGPDYRITQSWDTATKVNELCDFSVCVTIASKDHHYYIVDVFRKRMEFPDLKRAAVELAKRYRPSTVLIEDKSSGIQLIQELKAAGLYTVKPYKTPNYEKQMRVHAHTGKFEGGFVYLPKRAPWLEDYVRELTGFPNTKHDDQVDATVQAIDHLSIRRSTFF